jgi:pimeloyl-ACP methyl ester carboxylesterase
MPVATKHADAAPPRTGYSHAAKTAVQETTLRVKEMHRAIAGKSFGILRRIPLVAGPAQVVQSAHDVISAAVYAAIHHGSGGLLAAAAIVEKQRTGFAASKPPGRLVSGLRSALNAAFGDHLAASNNVLAIDMAIHANGAAIPLDGVALRSDFPEAGGRLCIFIHGLGCDEHSWRTGDAAAEGETDFGSQLHAEFDYTPLYLHYNSGLPIARNCAQLALLLEELLDAWPWPVTDLLIVGHSMGGLLALGACERAATSGLRWPQATRMLVSLGSPQLGSPLERLGHLTTAALNLSNITTPLARIAATRSQGIKDLRGGPGAAQTVSGQHRIAFRFLGASLAEDPDHPLGEFLGDGLVTLSSATAHAIEGDVQSARLGKLGHMRLLGDARVYQQIRAWLVELGDAALPDRR